MEALGYRYDLQDHEYVRAHAFNGWQFDPRDKQLPLEVDPELMGFQIEDQLQIGACQGHDLTSCAEWNILQEHGVTVQLSRWFAYRMTQRIDGISGDNGSTISGGLKLARETGLCLEELCPYPSSYVSFAPTQEQLASAALYRAGAWVDFRNMPGDPWDAGLQWLAAYGTISLGIVWPPGLNSDFVVETFTPGRGGGHAIAILGYVRINGVLYMKVANSWRKTWGRKGYFLISRRAFLQMIGHQYTACVGLTSMSSPVRKPRVWTPKAFSLAG